MNRKDPNAVRLSSGGQWAEWNLRDGLTHSRGGKLLNAGLKGVGTDGTLMLTPNRQANIGLNFIALQDDDPHTRRFMSLDVTAEEADVWRWGCAVWRNPEGETWAIIEGRKVLVPTAGPSRGARLLLVDGEWWVLYGTVDGRIVLHPITTTYGFVLREWDSQIDAADVLGGTFVELQWSRISREDWGVTVFDTVTHRLSGMDGADGRLDYVDTAAAPKLAQEAA